MLLKEDVYKSLRCSLDWMLKRRWQDSTTDCLSKNPEGFPRLIQNEQFWAHISGLLVREIVIYWEDRGATHSWGTPKAFGVHPAAFQQLSWECFLSPVDISLKKGHPVAGESEHIFSFGKEGTRIPSMNVRGTGEGGYLFTQDNSHEDLKTTSQRKPRCLPHVAFLRCLL